MLIPIKTMKKFTIACAVCVAMHCAVSVQIHAQFPGLKMEEVAYIGENEAGDIQPYYNADLYAIHRRSILLFGYDFGIGSNNPFITTETGSPYFTVEGSNDLQGGVPGESFGQTNDNKAFPATVYRFQKYQSTIYVNGTHGSDLAGKNQASGAYRYGPQATVGTYFVNTDVTSIEEPLFDTNIEANALGFSHSDFSNFKFSIEFDTRWATDISISFAARRQEGAPGMIHWSILGSDVAIPSTEIGYFWERHVIDLSEPEYDFIEHKEDVVIVGELGTFTDDTSLLALDNIQGVGILIPEPKVYAIAMGLIALFVAVYLRRRR